MPKLGSMAKLLSESRSNGELAEKCAELKTDECSMNTIRPFLPTPASWSTFGPLARPHHPDPSSLWLYHRSLPCSTQIFKLMLMLDPYFFSSTPVIVDSLTHHIFISKVYTTQASNSNKSKSP